MNHPIHLGDIEIVGESYNTNEIRKVIRIATGAAPSRDGGEITDLPGYLIPEPDNQYDDEAVAVYIGSHKVGHLESGWCEDDDQLRHLMRLWYAGTPASVPLRIGWGPAMRFGVTFEAGFIR